MFKQALCNTEFGDNTSESLCTMRFGNNNDHTSNLANMTSLELGT